MLLGVVYAGQLLQDDDAEQFKERGDYDAEVKSDQYGERMFYYYNPAIVSTMANEWFDPVHTAR